MLNKVADDLPHCAKVMHIVTACYKDVILFNILCIPPATTTEDKGYLHMVINWIPTLHARFSQDLHMNDGHPIVGRGHR